MKPHDIREFFATQREGKRDWEPLERMASDVSREWGQGDPRSKPEFWRLPLRERVRQLERMVEDVSHGVCVTCAAKSKHWDAPTEDGRCYECGNAMDGYAENPPHGHKGHRVSRNCDQCVENAS